MIVFYFYESKACSLVVVFAVFLFLFLIKVTFVQHILLIN